MRLLVFPINGSSGKRVCVGSEEQRVLRVAAGSGKVRDRRGEALWGLGVAGSLGGSGFQGVPGTYRPPPYCLSGVRVVGSLVVIIRVFMVSVAPMAVYCMWSAVQQGVAGPG